MISRFLQKFIARPPNPYPEPTGIRTAQKRYGARALTAGVILGCILIAAGMKAAGKGIVLGSLFSVLNFILMGEMMPARLGAGRKKAVLHAFRSILIRYVILAVPLFISIRSSAYEFVFTAAGLFFVQFSILAEHLRKSFRMTKENP